MELSSTRHHQLLLAHFKSSQSQATNGFITNAGRDSSRLYLV